MELDSLKELYTAQLATVRDAERQMSEILPRLIDAATARELKDALEHHLERTQHQVQRIEDVIHHVQPAPADKPSPVMRVLVEEAEETIQSPGDSSVRDAGLICLVQRMTHDQIALYGCARTFADLLTATDAAELLLESLEEEERVDKELTYLAKGLINIQAAEA